MNRTIIDLLNLDTGEQVKSSNIFSLPEKEIFDLRRKLKSNLIRALKNNEDPTGLACALCYQPVHIIGNESQKMYFRHGIESGSCPIKTGAKHSQEEIRCMKYNGAKESPLHKELKHHIANALERDSLFSNTYIEKTVRATGLSKEYRRPDVSTTLGNKKVVFEIQLSTTFLDVVISREEFYQEEKIFILWVFNGFTDDGKRFTEKDVYYANKCNAFIISDETKVLTRETGKLHLVCHYKEPYLNESDIAYRWKNKIVTFEDLSFDTETYKVYYFNYDTVLTKLRELLEFKWIRDDFQKFWIEKDTLFTVAEESSKSQQWGYIFIDLELVDKDQFRDGYLSRELQQILKALYALKLNQPIGYRYKSNPWLQISNVVMNTRHEFAGIYGHALNVYGLIDDVIAADKKMTFRNKYKEIKNGIKQGAPEYQQNIKFRDLFKALFPELFDSEI